jgi:hypothetical protein
MHEHLITRKNVQGCPEEVRKMIIVPENCFIVHPGRCHWQAQSFDDGKQKGYNYLVRWTGLDRMISFLELMQENMRSNLPLKVKCDILKERTSVLI